MADAAARAAYANVASVPAHQINQQNQDDLQSAEIQLKEVRGPEIDGDGEEEVDYEASDAEYDADILEYTDSVRDDDDDAYSYSASPEPEPLVERRPSLKRSSDDLLDPTDDADSEHSSHESRYFRNRESGGGTPPKRQRTDGSPTDDVDVTVSFNPILSPSPARLRKRSSEELEDEEGRLLNLSKRVKVDVPLSLVESPRSLVSDTVAEVVPLAPPEGETTKPTQQIGHVP